MQLPPIDVYLTWPAANYDNPTDVRGPAILILTLIFVPLLFLLVALRTYTRLRLTKNFGPDDVAIIAAVFPTLVCAVVTVLAVQDYGWNRHVWDVPLDELEFSLKLAIVVELLFSIACSLTRLSILLLICRIMVSGSNMLKKVAIGVMILVCVEECIFCVVVINTCAPVSAYWTLSFVPQQCINEGAHLLAAGVINTIHDFCVVLIPIPVVLKLRLPLRQRIICAMLFGAGFIVCIAGGFRMYYLYQLNNSYDKTWLSFPTWICGTIELYLGIITTTIPAIKPLVTRYFPNILGHNFMKHTLSSSRHMQFTDVHMDRGSVKTPHSDIDLDLVKSPDIEAVPVENNGTSAERRSLSLTPVVSAFSTYQKSGDKPARPVTEWKRSHPPIEEANSSGTSMSSFDASYMPEQAGD